MDSSLLNMKCLEDCKNINDYTTLWTLLTLMNMNNSS